MFYSQANAVHKGDDDDEPCQTVTKEVRLAVNPLVIESSSTLDGSYDSPDVTDSTTIDMRSYITTQRTSTACNPVVISGTAGDTDVVATTAARGSCCDDATTTNMALDRGAKSVHDGINSVVRRAEADTSLGQKEKEEEEEEGCDRLQVALEAPSISEDVLNVTDVGGRVDNDVDGSNCRHELIAGIIVAGDEGTDHCCCRGGEGDRGGGGRGLDEQLRCSGGDGVQVCVKVAALTSSASTDLITACGAGAAAPLDKSTRKLRGVCTNEPRHRADRANDEEDGGSTGNQNNLHTAPAPTRQPPAAGRSTVNGKHKAAMKQTNTASAAARRRLARRAEVNYAESGPGEIQQRNPRWIGPDCLAERTTGGLPLTQEAIKAGTTTVRPGDKLCAVKSFSTVVQLSENQLKEGQSKTRKDERLAMAFNSKFKSQIIVFILYC